MRRMHSTFPKCSFVELLIYKVIVETINVRVCDYYHEKKIIDVSVFSCDKVHYVEKYNGSYCPREAYLKGGLDSFWIIHSLTAHTFPPHLKMSSNPIS